MLLHVVALISLLKAVERFRLKPNYAAAFGELGLVMEKNRNYGDVQAYRLCSKCLPWLVRVLAMRKSTT